MARRIVRHAGSLRRWVSTAASESYASSAWTTIRRLPVEYPFAFGAGFSCAKTSAADLLVQKYIEKREEIDWKRNGAFASFGLVYLGGIQYVIYVPLFSRLFPSAAGFTAKSLRQKLADVPGMLNVVKQTALDQLVHHPFLYFPAFYATKAVVTEGLGPLESCAKGLSVYSENYREDLPALWKIWVPATLVNFAFSPMWFRIPFVACTSMLWTCILSAMRGSAEVELELELTDTSRTSDTFGSQGRQLTRILQRKFAYQNPANAQLVLTVSGADRAGIIGPLGALITEHGGNVGRSKQITMGSQFCLMIEISLDREGIHDLNTKLHSIQSSWGLHVATAEIKQQATAATGAGAAFVQAARRTAGGGEAEGGLGDLSFTVSGPDRVGIVAGMMGVFAAHNLSVTSLESQLLPGTGPEPRFFMSGSVLHEGGEGERWATAHDSVAREGTADRRVQLDELRQALQVVAGELGQTLTLTIKLD